MFANLSLFKKEEPEPNEYSLLHLRNFYTFKRDYLTEHIYIKAVESIFNRDAFVFIINDNSFESIRAIIALVKEKHKRESLRLHFFSTILPTSKDGSIDISFIKQSGAQVDFTQLYHCGLYGNYPYEQKVYVGNLCTMPRALISFIDAYQDKPEKLIDFFQETN
ncbi:MAG: hypothetical protein GWP10_06265 [Nitrospiraceae bacterium]|nr:hypothetical protein [Nitrospiraceae bacterium]